jgi:hypothetical protein
MKRNRAIPSEETTTMNQVKTKLFLLAGLCALAAVPGAKADTWNQKTILTFSGPVEIPGQVLPAGTYVFKLADSSSHRHIVQIFNKEENRVFGTFLAIPDYRLRASDKTIIRFEERTGGSPQAIKAWFYPGRNYGHEFVYPKKEAQALAAANNTAVAAMPTELATETTKPAAALKGPEIAVMMAAPLKAEEPNGTEVELAEAFETDPPATQMPRACPPPPRLCRWSVSWGCFPWRCLPPCGLRWHDRSSAGVRFGGFYRAALQRRSPEVSPERCRVLGSASYLS